MYRDTLITDIKAAIKTVVAELLPILFTRPPEGELPSADRQADMEGVCYFDVLFTLAFLTPAYSGQNPSSGEYIGNTGALLKAEVKTTYHVH